MSKRASASRILSTKRLKTEDLNDFWDDDFDGDAIDDCFKRATQQTILSKNDITLLSSYSVFEEQQGMLTSTQLTRAPFNSDDNLKDKVKELQQKYAEKEGEASILRSNLENLRASCHMDQEKKQLQWKEKLSAIEKENKYIKSEVEFKNLEIVNLKQQIAELSRHVIVEQNTQKPQLNEKIMEISGPEIPQSSSGNSRICVNTKRFTNTSRPEINMSLNVRLQNWWTSILNFKGGYPYQALKCLVTSSFDDPRFDDNNFYINKLMGVSLLLLRTFQDYLKQSKAPTEEIDVKYVQNYRITRMSSICTEVITFVEDVLHLDINSKYVSSNGNQIYLDKISIHREIWSNDMKNGTRSISQFFTALSNILNTITQTRKEEDCSDFVCAVMKLLRKIFTLEYLTLANEEILIQISKQLLFLSVDFELNDQICVFQHIVTYYPDSNYFLCSNSGKMEDNSDKEICRFYKYISSLERVMMMADEDVYSSIGSNVLNLTYNVFKLDGMSLHQQESRKCKCLCNLFKLAVQIIYKHIVCNFRICGLQLDLVNSHLKILSLLLFNVYDLSQKYVTDFAELREIIYSLTASGYYNGGINVKNLEKLCAPDDFQMISEERFLTVDF